MGHIYILYMCPISLLKRLKNMSDNIKIGINLT